MLPMAAVAIGSSAYKRARVFAFLDPWKDAQNTGFHIVQSLLALGSGGIFGLGLGQSLQKYFSPPEANTDFIFPVIAEEWGLIGTLTLVVVFLLIAWRGFTIAYRTKNSFGCLLASGLTTMVSLQALLNI